MFEIFTNGKNCRILCFLWIVLSINFLQAQDKAIPEKIYLHTDRSIYFVGEDLWYKAYDVNAITNILSDNSNVLYVELISPDSKIIARNKINLEIGLGQGDFQLKDSLGVKPGRYQIRAYTNWNRNFGDDFVFKKNIEIIDVFEDHSKFDKAPNSITPIKPKTIETNIENTVKVDFFPEGGSLLANVASVVGFKAVDSNGNPVEVSGEICDSTNELITSFASSHDGMGKFQMIPIEGKQYSAKIKTSSGIELRAELPKATEQGYSLSFKVFKGKNILYITTNPETLSKNPNQIVRIVCKSKGDTYLETTQKIVETVFLFELPKDKTPEGISQITLYDTNSKPQSERLVYMENQQDLDVQLVFDKQSYKPEEKTTISITSKTKTGEGKSASFSLSITDMNGEVVDKDLGTNICSYFLMESDIRGKVHHPAYYFDPANSKRLEDLDILLLTQGWRDFLWKTMPQKIGDFKVEKGITISGNVKQMFGNKPLVNSTLSLTLKNKQHLNSFKSISDSMGYFKFEKLIFSGKTTMFLNSKNEKGNYSGEIVLDSIEQDPLAVYFKKETFVLSETTKSIIENVRKKFTTFGVKPENVLEEVKIFAKNKNFVVVLYGAPDFSYVKDKDAQKFTDIRDLIEDKLPPDIALESTISPDESISDNPNEPNSNAAGPVVLIDGDPIAEKAELSFVAPTDVVKIEALKGTQTLMYLYGNQARNGVISVFTNGNRGNKPIKQSVHIFSKKIEGFYAARTFYTPNPEKPDIDLDYKAVVRNTIYWNPFVHPDKTGNVSVNYFNSGVETKVKVDLEGITGSGIPVVKKMYYIVKK